MSELRVDERVEGGWLPYSSELCVEHWFGFTLPVCVLLRGWWRVAGRKLKRYDKCWQR